MSQHLSRAAMGEVVARTAGVTKAHGKAAFDATIDAMTAAMRDGHEVRLEGFGTFSAPVKPARVGRNPGTGEAIQVPEHRAPKFKASPGLRRGVNP